MKKLLLYVLFSFMGILRASEWQDVDFKGIDYKGEKMKILIIGANGSVAREVTNAILKGLENVNLRLFLRSSSRLQNVKNANPNRVELFEGDATDKEALKTAMQGVDVVYANLAGNLPKMAEAIIKAMNETRLKRLIWISSYGIYQDEYKEIPNRNLGEISSALKPYVNSAKLIENSNLDYTIIRPQWFSNANEIDYELTQKGEVFKNPDALISRKSIAHLVIRLCLEKDFGLRQSLGINKPEK